MSKETEVIEMIYRNKKDGVFTLAELSEWFEKELKITNGAARSRSRRIINRLPVEALSLTMYRLTLAIESGVKPSKEKSVAEKETVLAVRESPSDAITYLNEKLGTRYKGKPADISRIKARMSPPENFTLDDFKTVVDKKISDWKGTHMERYLRPETLFGTKFESYLNEKNDIKEGRASQMAAYSFEKYLP
jgi:uncharacterized phage protein (TIGR02220 family)